MCVIQLLLFYFITDIKCACWLLCLESVHYILRFVVLMQWLLQQRETEASFVHIGLMYSLLTYLHPFSGVISRKTRVSRFQKVGMLFSVNLQTG